MTDAWEVLNLTNGREFGMTRWHLDRMIGWINQGEANACWPWIGARGPEGYGKLTVSYKSWTVTRLIMTLMQGPLPSGTLVRHKCDNPPCCNPAHLELGTAGDNYRDCVSRGRHPRGRTHGMTRYSEEQIRQVINLRRQRQTIEQIAANTGVPVATVWNVIKGKQWAELTASMGIQKGELLWNYRKASKAGMNKTTSFADSISSI